MSAVAWSGVAPVAPEVLAPAGDEDCLVAAIEAGADAVYLGLGGFNARARATNFDPEALARSMARLHRHGVKGYVTLNTLVFDAERAMFEAALRACAAAGADAIIVQDLGMARLARQMVPTMALHASTQMTCTDAGSVEFARQLGADRVVLARELSLEDIARIRASTDLPLEVFVHGALCVAYSGQCLTSEAIGGRSANRGACAQSCRLPYELEVDGERRDLGDRAFLLSPQDLEASELVPRLVALGVRSLKIEGRLKGPDYVAATTRLYRRAVDEAMAALGSPGAGRGLAHERELALQMYSRGSGPGFLAGIDHQRLVEGMACDHRGLQAGDVLGVSTSRGKRWLRVRPERALRRGDGVLVEGGLGGEGEVGGRIWAIVAGGAEVEEASPGREATLWLGPDRALPAELPRGRRLWRTDSPASEAAVRAETERSPHRVRLDVEVSGAAGERPVLRGRTARGAEATVTLDAALVAATSTPIDEAVLRDKLGKLGDTPFALGELQVDLPAGVTLPLSSLNRGRRALAAALQPERAPHPVHEPPPGGDELLVGVPAPAGLFVLCRSEAQAQAALDAGADGVYLDLLELTGTGPAMRALRARGAACVGVAPPRIRRPGEEKIDRYLQSLGPDMLLVRGLGALGEGAQVTGGPLRVGDFSLNVANRAAAHLVLGQGLGAFTPSYDLDAAQLHGLLDGALGPWAEVVVHQPMPLFHMEHCVYAALLSDGHDHRDCGRPCERHKVSLRDRAGMSHPVEADVGCRNTVFHGHAQSAAQLVAGLQKARVGRFRIELVREDAAAVGRLVEAYRDLLGGRAAAGDVWRRLRVEGGYGVVRGSLRVLA